MKRVQKSKNIKKQKSSQLLVKGILLVVCIALVLWGGIVVFSQSSFKKNLALATTVQPEQYTELYFDNHLSLPSQVTPGAHYSFKFTIHNLTGKDAIYPYEVYLTVGGKKILIDQKDILVHNNTSKTISETFTPNDVSQRSQIVVNLIKQNQQIAFWIEK